MTKLWPFRTASLPGITVILYSSICLLMIFAHENLASASDKVFLQLAWKHQFQFAGYYAALHQGYYRQAGLDVVIVEGGEGRFAREEVLGGRAQYGIAGAELILHRSEGDPFVVLAAIFQHSASVLLSRDDSNIAHPQNLVGKRLMLLSGNKDADILAIFQNEGIPMSLIHRINQSYNLDDLIKGRTDAVSAYITNEPWYLEQAGIKPRIMLPQTYGVDFYSDCLFTTDQEIKKRPQSVKKFREASLAGWDYAMENQEAMIDLLINHYAVKKSREHLQYEARTMENLIFPKLVEVGHMNPGRWKHIADTFARLGEMDKNFSLKGFLYDPDPKPDIKKLKFALFSLFFGFIGTIFIIILFLKINHKLKLEVMERQKTELSLRENKTRLQIIVETSRAGIILVDPKGIITFANQGMADMFGCSLDEMIGSSYPEHVHPDQRTTGDRRMHQLIAGEISSVALERHYLRCDGTDFWGFLSGRRHEDDNGNLISLVGIIADITEQKALEYELRQAHKMESIGTLTGGVAHDFNNILGVILGNTEMAINDLQEWNPAYSKLQTIKSASLKAAGIIRQLLNFSRKTEYELKPTDAILVIKDALKFLHSTIPKNIELRSHFMVTRAIILADPIQLNQVILNIFTNASQAMEETGGTLEITVETTTLKDKIASDKANSRNNYNLPPGHFLKLTISDTGPGMDTQIIDRIFDPYFTTKEVGRGSGMGLAIVMGIVKSHGGRISVNSQPGKGSTFTIVFPIVTAKPVAPEVNNIILTGSETILFVDDEELLVNMTQEMLESLGYQTKAVIDPVEALEIFKVNSEQFDLVITDMTMPQMTGVKLFEKLREIREDIPVIICTGHSSVLDEEKARKLGIAAFVMKPVGMEEISSTIRQVLDKTRDQQKLKAKIHYTK